VRAAVGTLEAQAMIERNAASSAGRGYEFEPEKKAANRTDKRHTATRRRRCARIDAGT
jgi:hypothetical protein